MQQSFMRARAESVPNFTAVERVDANGSFRRAVIGVALEEVNLSGSPIVDADESAGDVVGVKDRPRDRMTHDAEVSLDVTDEFEGIFAGAIALVHEREDRRAAAFADGEQLASPFLDALAIVEQHDGAVGGDECAVG